MFHRIPCSVISTLFNYQHDVSD